VGREFSFLFLPLHIKLYFQTKSTHNPVNVSLRFTISASRSRSLAPPCGRFPTGDVDEGVPGDGAVFAVEVEVEQSALPVAVVELVADVPAQRTKLLPLLRHGENNNNNTRKDKV